MTGTRFAVDLIRMVIAVVVSITQLAARFYADVIWAMEGLTFASGAVGLV